MKSEGPMGCLQVGLVHITHRPTCCIKSGRAVNSLDKTSPMTGMFDPPHIDTLKV